MSKAEKNLAYIDSELEELIPMFFENTREEIHALQNALEQEDYETLRRLGHSIKGASRGYGFEKMGDLGLTIENAAKEKQSIEELQRLLNELITHRDTVDVVYQ